MLNYRSYPKNKTGYPFFWNTLYKLQQTVSSKITGLHTMESIQRTTVTISYEGRQIFSTHDIKHSSYYSWKNLTVAYSITWHWPNISFPGKKDAAHHSCEKINQQYADHACDASKDSSGKVGIDCHMRLSSTSQSIDKVARLTDRVAVQTGELAAIRMALQNIPGYIS